VTRAVLLDDDEDVLDALAALLAVLGAPALLARSLEELAARRDDVLGADLAILDLNLGPEQPTGIDAFDWLRGAGFAGRIMFLPGHGAGDLVFARAFDLSDVELLRKPIGLDELRALVTPGG